MKFIKTIILIFTVSLVLFSCSEKKNTKTELEVKPELAMQEDLQNITVAIEGMTCEIGCAKLIESKLVKTEGVEFVAVNFEAKEGNITYHANKINKEELKNVIQNIAGGDLYSVTAIKEVQSFEE